ncbi:MAG: hypothetical protein EZS28_003908 [Streblomastix strix]|uniref:Uncharacterized protein n=1 Tax=Streblomastix strix TaxID=222440 RepID=A0A5J4X055_9EUKA|nr:MAG: hypothetical protein EZS28_003908 [Streblomastix strix]
MALRSDDCVCLGMRHDEIDTFIEKEKEKEINNDILVQNRLKTDESSSQDDFEELFYSEESVIPDTETDESYLCSDSTISSMTDISIPQIKKRKRRRSRQCDSVQGSDDDSIVKSNLNSIHDSSENYL